MSVVFLSSLLTTTLQGGETAETAKQRCGPPRATAQWRQSWFLAPRPPPSALSAHVSGGHPDLPLHNLGPSATLLFKSGMRSFKKK